MKKLIAASLLFSVVLASSYAGRNAVAAEGGWSCRGNICKKIYGKNAGRVYRRDPQTGRLYPVGGLRRETVPPKPYASKPGGVRSGGGNPYTTPPGYGVRADRHCLGLTGMAKWCCDIGPGAINNPNCPHHLALGWSANKNAAQIMGAGGGRQRLLG